eukprot:COSAG02_NODE_8318_length_2618_cov_1.533148_3_plen_48_part_00
MDGAGLGYLFVLLLGFYSFFLVRKGLLSGCVNAGSGPKRWGQSRRPK